MKRILILASGSGSNAENIITYFKDKPAVTVAAVLTNKSTAPVLQRCKRLATPAFFFNKAAFAGSDAVLRLLKGLQPRLIVLAGFLWKIPPAMVHAFPNRIINIHPALLPKHGGKGMYGTKVHQAVKDGGDTATGISIHYVNEAYDEGAVIFQAKTAVAPTDDVDAIAQKVHQLEYQHLPEVIEKLLLHGQKE